MDQVNRWVMLVDESVTGDSAGRNDTTIVHLPCSNGVRRAFMINKGRLLELQSTRPAAPASWFIDQSVKSDGGVLVATPFDPVFLLLAPLERNGGRMSPLYQYLGSEGGADGAGTDLRVLLQLGDSLHTKLAAVCDVEDGILEGPEHRMYRLNESKLLSWLTHRVRRCALLLQRQEDMAIARARVTAASTFSATSTVAAASSSSSGGAGSAAAAPASAASLWQVPDDEAVAAATLPNAMLESAVSIVGENLPDKWAIEVARAVGVAPHLALPRLRHVLAAQAALTSPAASLTSSAAGGGGAAATSPSSPASTVAADAGSPNILDDSFASVQRLLLGRGGGSGSGGKAGGSGGEGEGGKKKAPSGPVTIQQKRLASTNISGMKSMASYFGAKK